MFPMQHNLSQEAHFENGLDSDGKHQKTKGRPLVEHGKILKNYKEATFSQ